MYHQLLNYRQFLPPVIKMIMLLTSDLPPSLPPCLPAASGELFAVGAFNTLRLCDKTGVGEHCCLGIHFRIYQPSRTCTLVCVYLKLLFHSLPFYLPTLSFFSTLCTSLPPSSSLIPSLPPSLPPSPQWSHSLDKPHTGTVLRLAWASDGTQFAGAGGCGQVVFAQVVDRRLEWGHLEATVKQDGCIDVRDVCNDARECLEFSDRIVRASLSWGHLVVATTVQCFVYK